MPRLKVSSQMTTTQVAKRLNMSIGRLLRWIERGVLPPPSFFDNNGVRYFDQEWLGKAKEIVADRKGGLSKT